MFWRVLFKNVFLKFFKSDVALLTNCQSQTFMYHLIPNVFAWLCISLHTRSSVSRSPAEFFFFLLQIYLFKGSQIVDVHAFPMVFHHDLAVFSPSTCLDPSHSLKLISRPLSPACFSMGFAPHRRKWSVGKYSALGSCSRSIVRKSSVTIWLYFQ